MERLRHTATIVGFDQIALDDAARRGFSNGASEDSEEDIHIVIEEFFVNSEPANTAVNRCQLPALLQASWKHSLRRPTESDQSV